ncbi:T9SS type A sorting domain-containing protein [Oceanihabitans sediminis]|uniref:T9SS type A sorting domain-containing protein n=1 Tax=Oceanihabitans sediminis TaxID=1812012 RepID=UPI00299E47FB|nr:T9SS type A sorting domain-containing protein [Oceanihabitans sediminis]MDX1279228.1 T9SS type A sorting domain-containing protein [Oceanihabitans sediminis]
MKKQLLLLLVLILIQNELSAQVKSTGVVNLLSGMTARIDLDNSTNTATLTFTGPADRWFALQFGEFNNGDGMQNGEDVVYYNGTSLVDAVHNSIGVAPSSDSNDWNLISNTVSSGTRTLVATRLFDTGDTNDYIFNYSNNSIDFAFSRSSSASFSLAYHGFSNRGYAIDNQFTTLSIEDFKVKSNVTSLIPNPATSSFKIHTNSEQKIVQATIYNALGQKIRSIKKDVYNSINVSNLPAGNYYVEVLNDSNEIVLKKIIIN